MNLAKFTKAQLVEMSRKYCKHGHTYIEHPQCYLQEEQGGERIGFLDIECSNLSADFGIILSYCIKELGGDIYGRVIKPSEIRSARQDCLVVKACLADMARFDRIITFYGSRFDIPFVRARALAHGLQFPEYGTIKHTDIWFWVKSALKLHRSRLQTVCDFFNIPSKEHKLDGLLWTRALSGSYPDLSYIFAHNKEDVISTEAVYLKLLPYKRCTATCM